MKQIKILISIIICFLVLNSTVLAKNIAETMFIEPVLKCDSNGNGLSDALEESVNILMAKGQPGAPISIIVLFSTPPQKQDVDLIQRYGGQVKYLYHRVINGLSCTVPASFIDDLALQWGPKLTLMDVNSEMKLAMDTTVPQTRARPLVWDAAPNGYGLRGDPGTVLAIIDSGLDMSHPDLAGKLSFWHDFHEEGYVVPVDYNSHGTFVAGIACGSGTVSGNEPITQLIYTVWIDFNALYQGGLLGFWLPVVGDGEVSVDMIRWPYYQESCIGFGPADGVLDGPHCSTMAPHVRSWSFSESGYYNFYLGVGDYTPTQSSTQITTPYAQLGDGYNLLSGMAPECRLAGFKIGPGENSWPSFVDDTIAAMDSLVAINSQYGIKVANLSAGASNSLALRLAAGEVMSAGTVMVGITHNYFPGVVNDPGKSEFIITVGAVNDFGALTNYTSRGDRLFPTKPDVLAPGGAGPPPEGRGSGVLGVDSNFSDGFGYPDRVEDDYAWNGWGTSYAAPHVTGLAALVIEALETTGNPWTYTHDEAMLVKSIILMTATETNMAREENQHDYEPVLNRGEKDHQEGYGLINADAAVETILQAWPSNPAQPVSITFGNEPSERRCWAAALNTEEEALLISLTVPPTLDADIYIYTADFYDGDPDLVASSINPNEGDGESLDFVAEPGVEYYLTVKRISGFGEAVLNMVDPLSGLAGNEIPQTRLVGNSPNPFNPRTTIKFNVGQEERVQVSVYDLAGRQVALLEDRVFAIGLQETVWDGMDKTGRVVASGNYFVRLRADGSQQQKKIMLVR